MKRVVDDKGSVLAEHDGSYGEPDLMRCCATLGTAQNGKAVRCMVLIQRTSDGDLVDGVRAHYRMCHPERKIR